MRSMGLHVARVLVEYEIRQIGLQGRILVTSIRKTPRGDILWLKADEDALVGLR